jgi:TPR repeat protein
MARLPRIRRNFANAQELIKAADDGDPQAQNDLGNAYATGTGIKQDRLKALHWWLKAAEGGDALAMDRLGDVFRTGEVMLEKVTPIDLDRAIDWYKKSAAAGFHEALFGLGRIYQQQQDFKKAAATFKESAYIYGKRESLREYGMCVFHGNGVPKDVERGRDIIAEAALMDEEFSALGRTYLAQNYGVTLSMPENSEARRKRKLALESFQFNCLQKRAEGGDVDAQVELAHKYIFGGKHNELNRDKAYFWFRRAGEAGDAEAQFELGRSCDSGASAQHDHEQAFGWYKKSADQGYRDGLREAGRCLYFGEGVKPDYKQAAIYFEKAVKLQDSESMVFLGKMLQDGLGMRKNPERGQKLIDAALEQDKKGIGLAKHRLATLNETEAAKAKKRR